MGGDFRFLGVGKNFAVGGRFFVCGRASWIIVNIICFCLLPGNNNSKCIRPSKKNKTLHWYQIEAKLLKGIWMVCHKDIPHGAWCPNVHIVFGVDFWESEIGALSILLNNVGINETMHNSTWVGFASCNLTTLSYLLVPVQCPIQIAKTEKH